MPQYDLSGNPLPDENQPRTDLAGNPLPPTYPAPPPRLYAGSNQGGTHGSPQATGAWPPAPVAPSARAEQQNTSGLKSTVPPEIANLKWNWGAFLCPFFWAWSNKQPVYCLLVATLFIGAMMTQGAYSDANDILGISLYAVMGATGHKLSWKSRYYPGGVREYFDVQRAWMKWGFALVLVLYGGVAFIYRVLPFFSGR